MSEPRQFAPIDLERAARGHRITRGTGRPGKQPSQGPVTVEAQLHLSLTAESELDGRRALLALQTALFDRGFSVEMVGPSVVPAEPQKPRRLQ